MKRYVATFYRHWWLYLPILILLLTASAIGTKSLISKDTLYQSTTRLWVSEPVLQQALGTNQPPAQLTPAQQRNDMLFQLIQTDSFIRNIVKGTPTEQLLNGDVDHDAPVIAKVRSTIRIQVLGANSLLVSYQDTTPELAKTILQNIVNEFRNWLLASNLEQASAEKSYYEQQAASFQQQVNQAQKALDDFTAQHPTIKPDDLTAQAQLQALQSQLQAARQTYLAAQSKLEEAELVNTVSSSSNDGSTFRTLDAPTQPGKPSSILHKEVKYLGLGIAASFLFVITAIVVLTWTDKSVWTSEEVEAQSRVPVLAVVPHLGRRKEWGSGLAGRKSPARGTETNVPSATTG